MPEAYLHGEIMDNIMPFFEATNKLYLATCYTQVLSIIVHVYVTIVFIHYAWLAEA